MKERSIRASVVARRSRPSCCAAAALRLVCVPVGPRAGAAQDREARTAADLALRRRNPEVTRAGARPHAPVIPGGAQSRDSSHAGDIVAATLAAGEHMPLWAGRRGQPYVRCFLGSRRQPLGRHPSGAASRPAASRTSRAGRGTAARTSASSISPSVALTTMPTPTDSLPQNSASSSLSVHTIESAANWLERKRAKPAANAGGSTARRSRNTSRASSRARRDAT